VAPDGSPAEYDKDNVPYKPEHYLAVSNHGLEDGDFAMAVGYPGRTYRHRLALEAADVSNWFYPTRKQHFEEVLAIIERETRDREDAAIKYSALVQGLNNVIKNYGGMIEGFARSGLVDRKRRAEVELRTWLADNDRQDDSLAKLGTLVREYRDGREQRMIYDDFLRRRAALLSAAATLYRLSIETEKPDNERKIGFQQRDRDRIRERMTRLPRSYDPAVDQAMLVHHVEAYSALPADQRIAALDRWLGGNDAGIDTARARKRINDAYGQTRLGDSEALLAWLDAGPGEFRNSDDPFIQLAVALYDSDIAREDQAERYAGRFQFARSQYMATLSDWYEDLGKPLYPDANSTLRVTFGIVKGYQPRDAVIYEPFTHVSGVIEKHTGENPFDSPPALLAAIDQQMSSGDGNEIPVNFLATLDSTGGNSGSAVLDSQGELVGLLFDGNYESINADWYFDEAITRTICVDMRYVLWIMDTVDGAHHLLREMGIGPRAMQAYELN
ncbi:MAG: S46 family peptidase, partial [Gammaproteobacteria bacterium]|nr:S46 family peptidase [Gammaproteobacteria bacterium]